ncbi:hypothetical protein M8818_007696 [Zalaria obscura]|uniref:Uncharacterized protein n=1 Tax=Zalaria obscura TaxID=2024903 RepID=A0ACC3S2Y3_9PEZI
MYAQNVVEDTEDEPVEHLGTTNAIPVGFPGHDQPFHRRRGPDGEEQDIIGTDGHSEQLPPYSEYPEDGPPKDTILPLHTAAPGQHHLRCPDPGYQLVTVDPSCRLGRPKAWTGLLLHGLLRQVGCAR